jgi:hypothetical protein
MKKPDGQRLKDGTDKTEHQPGNRHALAALA